jgi:hypothetical protein
MSDFNEGMAYVLSERDKSIIDTLGKTIIKFIDYRPFINNIALIKSSGRWYFIDKTGAEVKTKYENIRPFKLPAQSEIVNKFIVKNSENGKFGVIDSAYNEIIPTKYDKINEFNHEKQTSLVTINEKIGMIDINGNEITPFYDVVYTGNSIFKIIIQDGKYGILSDFGIIDCKYDFLPPFQDWAIAAKFNGKWGVINGFPGDDHVKLPFIYDNVTYVKNNTVNVLENEKWYFVDLKNKNKVLAQKEPNELDILDQQQYRQAKRQRDLIADSIRILTAQKEKESMLANEFVTIESFIQAFGDTTAIINEIYKRGKCSKEDIVLFLEITKDCETVARFFISNKFYGITPQSDWGEYEVPYLTKGTIWNKVLMKKFNQYCDTGKGNEMMSNWVDMYNDYVIKRNNERNVQDNQTAESATINSIPKYKIHSQYENVSSLKFDDGVGIVQVNKITWSNPNRIVYSVGGTYYNTWNDAVVAAYYKAKCGAIREKGRAY